MIDTLRLTAEEALGPIFEDFDGPEQTVRVKIHYVL